MALSAPPSHRPFTVALLSARSREVASMNNGSSMWLHGKQKKLSIGENDTAPLIGGCLMRMPGGLTRVRSMSWYNLVEQMAETNSIN